MTRIVETEYVRPAKCLWSNPMASMRAVVELLYLG